MQTTPYPQHDYMQGRGLWWGWYGHGRITSINLFLHSNTLLLLYKSAKK